MTKLVVRFPCESEAAELFVAPVVLDVTFPKVPGRLRVFYDRDVVQPGHETLLLERDVDATSVEGETRIVLPSLVAAGEEKDRYFSMLYNNVGNLRFEYDPSNSDASPHRASFVVEPSKVVDKAPLKRVDPTQLKAVRNPLKRRILTR